MRKTIVNSLLAGALAVGLTACSNDDSGPTEGLATFYHSVPDAGLLRMEGEDRNFGSVDYQQFGSGILLDTGGYELSVKDLNTDDISASKELLSTNFDVYDTRERNVYALSGSAMDNTITLHELRTAVDKDSKVYDSNADTDEDIIWINAAHIHPSYQSDDLQFYLLQNDETVENSSPEFTLGYGEDSEPVQLTTNKQRLIIVNSANSDVLFDSGDRTILDQFTQMLMFAQHPNTPDAGQVVYYYVSGNEIWGSNSDTQVENKVEVRLLNAVFGSVVADAATTGTENLDLVADSTVDFGAVSSAVSVDPGVYDVEVDFDGTDENGGLAVLMNAGYLETLIVTGRLGSGEKLSATVLSDDKRALIDKARIKFVNLGYQTDSDDYEAYNVHLTKAGSLEDLVNRTPEVSTINYLEQANIERIVSSSNTDGETYELRVMKTDNIGLVAKIALVLKVGESKQVALIQNNDGSPGYQLVDITPTDD